jgi:uncharacterized protein YbjT (DUF2867 family)
MTGEYRTALLAGASGLVGRELLRLIVAEPRYGQVHNLVRRATGTANPKVVEHVVSFDALPALPRVDDAFITLGTTIKVAGSQEAFRRVDYDYVVAVARAARDAGATRLGIVSALGADAGSRVFYNRVKGEMQEAVFSLGYESVVIAQPSLLVGDREALGQPTRAGERWAQRLLTPMSALIPSSFRPVQARDVAASLLARVLVTERGNVIVPSREILGAASD